MLHFLVRRIIQLIPVLFLVSFFVFFIINLIPGDPVLVMMGEELHDQEVYEALRKQLGLDKPIHIRYLHWMGRVVQGDWCDKVCWRS